MDGSVSLSVKDRKALVRRFRAGITPETLRAAKQRWSQGGLTAIATMRPARTKLLAAWLVTITTWVTQKTPRDFGLYRSRWSCATIAIVLVEEEGATASLETICRGLHESLSCDLRQREVPHQPRRASVPVKASPHRAGPAPQVRPRGAYRLSPKQENTRHFLKCRVFV